MTDPAERAGSQASGPTEPPGRTEPWLSAGVASVGAASFCSDTGHEITTALLPSLLPSTLHATPDVLGVVEGTSDALAGLAKLAGGPPADVPARRARIATGGYLGTALATGAIGLAATVWQVGVHDGHRGGAPLRRHRPGGPRPCPSADSYSTSTWPSPSRACPSWRGRSRTSPASRPSTSP
ncbi:conserved hypothetical protein [Streptomyces sp. e14]|nr:conserved hypothetical protein [Streptomyces sp. e14]